MRYECRITVLETKCFPELQEKYLATVVPGTFKERDRFLVSYASVVLAVYNGERRGGTAATVRYARKLGRELIVIDPATRTVTHG